MSNKNPGQKLYFSQFGGERPIPPEFIAAMQREEEKQSVPEDVGPEELSDTIVESKVETDRNNERVRTTIKKKAGTVGPLLDIRTNDNGFPVQVSTTLHPTGSAPTPPSATTNFARKDLGNGWSIDEVAVEGTYVGGVFVPGVFGGNVFERERPNLTPEKFRPGVPTVTTRTDSAGVAVDPTLSGDELRERQEQITAGKKRVEIVTQAVPTLPVTLSQGRATNQAKQDVIVTDKLIADITPSDTATALKDVEVEQLGDGRKVQRTKEVVAVFAESEFTKKVPDVVPEKFKVAAPITETSSIVTGTASTPVLGVGDLEKTEKQVTVFTKFQRLLSRAGISLPVSLISKDTDQDRQIVTVTETLRLAGIDALPTATQKVKTQNLGDGTVVETKENIPSVFDPAEFTVQIPDPVPDKFKVAVPITTTEHKSAGTAVTPTLGAGDLSITQKQSSVFEKIIRVATRAGLILPISLASKKTNSKKQVVTVTETYRVAGIDPTPTATRDVVVENQGDGRVLETVEDIPSVFADTVFEATLPDPVPAEFRTSPDTSTESTSTGAVAPPTLTGEQFHATSTKVDQFNVRNRVVTHGTAATQLSDKELDGINDGHGSLFNGAVTIQRFLQATAQVIDSGFLIIKSRVKDLGVGSKTLKETSTITSYPTLFQDEIEAETGAITTRVKTIVAAGSAHPGGYVEQFPLDKDRSLRTTHQPQTGSYSAFALKFVGSTNVDFPVELTKVTGYVETHEGGGTYGENGSYGTVGEGSISINLHANAQGSAAVLPDIGYEFKQPRGENFPCTHCLFYITSNTSLTDILGRLGTATFIGTTVNAWPKFVPQPVTFVCHGQKMNGTVQCGAHAADSLHTDYLGAPKHNSFVRTSGFGFSYDAGVVIKVERIPPTIHPLMTTSNLLLTGQGFTPVVKAVNASCTLSTGVNGPGTVSLVGASATGSIEPTSVPATSGTTKIPTTGFYLYRMNSEPAKYGYIKVHCEVINMADSV